MSLAIIIEPLGGLHDRQNFDCGIDVLNRYLREQASQDIKRRLGNCFVALDHSSGQVAGYYTLAASSIPTGEVPDDAVRRLPRYPLLPATLIGRLAVDRRFQGKQIGLALIVDAMRRSLQAAPASFTLLVDAKDERATTFYEKLGFMPLRSRPRSLFLPIATGMKLFARFPDQSP